MLKGIEYLALIAAVVFAVCLIALMFFYASPSSTPHAPQQQNSEKNEHVQHQSEAEKPFWEKATTDPIAAFTLFLVIFTAVLSGVGAIQLKLLVRAETVAEKTANAAKESADATRESVNLSRANAERQLRAYVFIQGGQIQIVNNGNAIYAAITLKNLWTDPWLRF